MTVKEENEINRIIKNNKRETVFGYLKLITV